MTIDAGHTAESAAATSTSRSGRKWPDARSVAVGVALGTGLALSLASPADARPSDPGVVNYAVLPKGSVGNIVGARMGFEWTYSDPFQSFYVDNPVCNNWADIGLPEVYNDPDLAAFNGAVAQQSPTDMTHFV
ncbi:MAG: sensor domain-containing protein, partial [Dietzia sp.]|nr:sensor domain-containing protein [Dietzia sp.]